VVLLDVSRSPDASFYYRVERGGGESTSGEKSREIRKPPINGGFQWRYRWDLNHPPWTTAALESPEIRDPGPILDHLRFPRITVAVAVCCHFVVTCGLSRRVVSKPVTLEPQIGKKKALPELRIVRTACTRLKLWSARGGASAVESHHRVPKIGCLFRRSRSLCRLSSSGWTCNGKPVKISASGRHERFIECQASPRATVY